MESKPATAIRLLALVAIALPAAAAPRTYSIDGKESTASARVGKTGIVGFAGHEHTVVAHGLQGEVVLDPADLAKSSVDLIVPARSLKVVEQGEPEGDAPKVEQVMLGPGVLDVARFSTIHVQSAEVKGKESAPGTFALTVSGDLSLHGVTRPFTLPIQLEVRGDVLTASGKLSIRQTDFGIEPTTAAGGLVKVADEVALTFRISARAF